jgi:hypothetical protein
MNMAVEMGMEALEEMERLMIILEHLFIMVLAAVVEHGMDIK